MKVGYALSGYPASGKSTAGEILAGLVDGINIETGNIVRREAANHFDCPVDNLSSDELGEYSTMRRETDGGDYVAQDVVSDLEGREGFPERSAVVTGMRDAEVPELFRDYFDRFAIIWVEASFEERLSRLQQRGRQDEADFTAEDLRNRDEREEGWGTADIEPLADYRVTNDEDVKHLTRQLREVTHKIEDR